MLSMDTPKMDVVGLEGVSTLDAGHERVQVETLSYLSIGSLVYKSRVLTQSSLATGARKAMVFCLMHNKMLIPKIVFP